MNCSQFEEYASLYIDEMLTEEEMINFKKHLETCENCSISLENLQRIVSTVNEMEEIDLPTDFTLSLRKKLEKEKEIKSPLFNWRIASGIAAALLIATISLTAMEGIKPRGLMLLDSSETENMAVEDQYGGGEGEVKVFLSRQASPNTDLSITNKSKSVESAADIAMADETETEVSITSMEMATENRKIINKGRLALETIEFDDLYEKTYRIVESNGGYFQNSDTQYRLLNREKPDESLRVAYLVIRVPSQNFKEVFRELKELGVVINENTNAQDITLTYRDVETEVLNLEVQEERLREILKKAEKIEDILRIENELSRVRLQINSMRGTLKSYDHLVSLSTIEIELMEVKEITEPTIKIQSVEKGVLGRGKESFIKSVNQIISFGERALINLYGLIPWALLLTVIILPAVSIGKKIIKKRRNNIAK